MVKKPKTFEHFPEDVICPVCHSNEDSECVLLKIPGTGDGKICEAIPVHLWCAVADTAKIFKDHGIVYRLC